MPTDDLERTPGQMLAAVMHDKRSRQQYPSVQVQTRALLGVGQSGSSAWATTDAPRSPSPYRQPHVRDLFTPVPTTLTRVPYIREVNRHTNEGATGTLEGAAKAEQTMEFDTANHEAYLKKPTAWIPVTTDVYEDGPGLAAYVDGRLRTVVLEHEDDQLLNGTGDLTSVSDPDMLGILQDPDVPVVGPSGSFRQRVLAAIASVGNAGGNASGVVVSWDDWAADMGWGSIDERDGGTSFWGDLGLTVVRTRRMPNGTVLAGDFPAAAMLRTRDKMTVRVGDQHSDYFIKNKLAVVAELREVLTINAPDLFAIGTAA